MIESKWNKTFLNLLNLVLLDKTILSLIKTDAKENVSNDITAGLTRRSASTGIDFVQLQNF